MGLHALKDRNHRIPRLRSIPHSFSGEIQSSDVTRQNKTKPEKQDDTMGK
jgi:hypothetical protein